MRLLLAVLLLLGLGAVVPLTCFATRFGEPPVWPAKLSKSSLNEYRDIVRDMFNWAFTNYMEKAFPQDELNSLACRGDGPYHGNDYLQSSEVHGGYSLTLIDSLDTLALMNNTREFQRAFQLLNTSIKFNATVSVSIFEANIRVLGSLLSAHQLCKRRPELLGDISYRDEFLERALELGNILYSAFAEAPRGLPYPHVFLHTKKAKKFHNTVNTATAGSLVLEFGTLSRLTGDFKFEKVARKAMEVLWNIRSTSNLLGVEVNLYTLHWTWSAATIGAGQDSFHEYLLKAWVLLSNSPMFEYYTTFQMSYAASKDYLKRFSGYAFTAVNMESTQKVNDLIDSLSAYFPGLQALYGELKEALVFHQFYINLWAGRRGIPELYSLENRQHWLNSYMLRPEFIESNYLLYRATKHPYFLAVGQMVVDDLQRTSRSTCGFGGPEDIDKHPTLKNQNQESFFLSETLKYLYLLFDESHWLHGIDSPYMFTTEAHLLFPESETREFPKGTKPFDKPKSAHFRDRHPIASFNASVTALNGTCESLGAALSRLNTLDDYRPQSPFSWPLSPLPLYVVGDLDYLTGAHLKWVSTLDNSRSALASEIALSILTDKFDNCSRPQCRANYATLSNALGSNTTVTVQKLQFRSIGDNGLPLTRGRVLLRNPRGLHLTSLAGLEVTIRRVCSNLTSSIVPGIDRNLSNARSGEAKSSVNNCSVNLVAVEDFLLDQGQGVFLIASDFRSVSRPLKALNGNPPIIDAEVTDESPSQSSDEVEASPKDGTGITGEPVSSLQQVSPPEETFVEVESAADLASDESFQTDVSTSPTPLKSHEREKNDLAIRSLLSDPLKLRTRLVKISVAVKDWSENAVNRVTHPLVTFGVVGDFGVGLDMAPNWPPALDDNRTETLNMSGLLTMCPYNSTHSVQDEFPGIGVADSFVKVPPPVPHPFSHACAEPFPSPFASTLEKYSLAQSQKSSIGHPLWNMTYDNSADFMLAGRGSCLFAEKALVANLLKKRVLLIGNDREGLFIMQSSADARANLSDSQSAYYSYIDSLPVVPILIDYPALMTIGNMVDGLDTRFQSVTINVAYQKTNIIDFLPSLAHLEPPSPPQQEQSVSRVEEATFRRSHLPKRASPVVSIPASKSSNSDGTGVEWNYNSSSLEGVKASTRGVLSDVLFFLNNEIPVKNLFLAVESAF